MKRSSSKPPVPVENKTHTHTHSERTKQRREREKENPNISQLRTYIHCGDSDHKTAVDSIFACFTLNLNYK